MKAPVVLVVCVDLKVVASMDQDLPRVGVISGASIYPFAWNILLAARHERLAGTITTLAAARGAGPPRDPPPHRPRGRHPAGPAGGAAHATPAVASGQYAHEPVSGIGFVGRSAVVDPWGVVIATAPDRECVTVTTIDLDQIEEVAYRYPLMHQRRPALYGLVGSQRPLDS